MNRRPFLKQVSIVVCGVFTGIVTAVRAAHAQTTFFDQVRELPQPTDMEQSLQNIVKDLELTDPVQGSLTFLIGGRNFYVLQHGKIIRKHFLKSWSCAEPFMKWRDINPDALSKFEANYDPKS